MRILVCRPPRAHEPIEQLITALLQEGHAVHPGRPDRAGRRFAPGLVIARYAPGLLGCAWFARRRHVPLCLLVDTKPKHPPPLLERLLWRGVAHVLATSSTLKEDLIALGVAAETIELVPGGVLPERIPPAPFAPDRPAGVVLGWFGGGAPATTAAPDLALTTIDAAVPAARLPDLLAGIDIALFPEPAPARLIDCMAAGCAIVAPDRPEVGELLEHGRTALLFDPAEAGALQRAAARLIADPPLRARLGEAARAEIMRRDLTWRGVARRLIERLGCVS
jgi:glycosyltransferase involved in cell wall biosynthesis